MVTTNTPKNPYLLKNTLRIYADGGARPNPGPAAIGIVLCDVEDNIVHQHSKHIGECTNNMAEYQALIHAVRLGRQYCRGNVECYMDSELVVKQFNGQYRIKDPKMNRLFEELQGALHGSFDDFSLFRVPREHPLMREADKLANTALNKLGY